MSYYSQRPPTHASSMSQPSFSHQIQPASHQKMASMYIPTQSYYLQQNQQQHLQQQQQQQHYPINMSLMPMNMRLSMGIQPQNQKYYHSVQYSSSTTSQQPIQHRTQSAYFNPSYDDQSLSFAASKTSGHSSSALSLSSLGAVAQKTRKSQRSHSFSSIPSPNAANPSNFNSFFGPTPDSSNPQSSSTSTHSMSHPSLNVAPAPDRYHRRKSTVSLSSAAHLNVASSSSTTTGSDGSSSSSSTNSTTNTNPNNHNPNNPNNNNNNNNNTSSSSSSNHTPASSSSSASASTASSSAMSNPSTLATSTPISGSTVSIPDTSVSLDSNPKQPIYKQSALAGSVSAFSNSSASKKDYSSLSSVSSFGSDVPTSSNSIQPSQRKSSQKGFIATSVTPLPSLPPPLVLPSEIRKSSLVASAAKSRSASPASISQASKIKQQNGPATTPKNSSSASVNSVPVSIPRRSSTPGVDSVKSIPAASYNPYTGSKNPAAKAATFTSSTIPPSINKRTQSDSYSTKSLTSSSLAPPIKPPIISGRSQSMTLASQTFQDAPKTPKQQPPPEKKSSFGDRLKKAFSFGSRKDLSSSQKSQASNDNSFSFVKKKKPSTMSGAIVPPNLTTKESRSQTISLATSSSSSATKKSKNSSSRSHTMSSTLQGRDRSSSSHSHTFSFSRKGGMFGGSSSRRSSIAPSTFEGFTSSNVEVKSDGDVVRRGRSKSTIDDDAVSVHSAHSSASNASFATLRKMGKSLFSKNSFSNLQHQNNRAPDSPKTDQGGHKPKKQSSSDASMFEYHSTDPKTSNVLDLSAASSSPFGSSSSNANGPTISTSSPKTNGSAKPPSRSRTSSITTTSSPATTSVSHAVAEADRPVPLSSASCVLNAAIQQHPPLSSSFSTNPASTKQQPLSNKDSAVPNGESSPLVKSLKSFTLDPRSDDNANNDDNDDDLQITAVAKNNDTQPKFNTGVFASNSNAELTVPSSPLPASKAPSPLPSPSQYGLRACESDESSEEDLNAADTVFPKNLDNQTVETIRSSLERTKSLERRRSRRSTRSNKSGHNKGNQNDSINTSGDAPAKQVHISSDQVSLNEPSHDAVASRSILKPADSTTDDKNPQGTSIPPVPQVDIQTLSSKASVETGLNSRPNSTQKRNSKLNNSPSMNSIFNFGDDELNLDFDFTPLPATEDLTLGDASDEDSEQKENKNNCAVGGDKGIQKTISTTVTPPSPPKTESPRQPTFHRKAPSSVSAPSPAPSPVLSPGSKSSNATPALNETLRSYPNGAVPHQQFQRNTSSTSMRGVVPNGSQSSLRTNPAAYSKTLNVSFSSRIIIYDTYDSQDYDRRAEPSTCNRLTPLLAQQIKEELNHFKMEMDVHSESRIYTHFYG